MNDLQCPLITQVERTGYTKSTEQQEYTILDACECSEVAKIKINGILHCWDCAEDAGVERL